MRLRPSAGRFVLYKFIKGHPLQITTWKLCLKRAPKYRFKPTPAPTPDNPLGTKDPAPKTNPRLSYDGERRLGQGIPFWTNDHAQAPVRWSRVECSSFRLETLRTGVAINPCALETDTQSLAQLADEIVHAIVNRSTLDLTRGKSHGRNGNGHEV